MRYHKCEQETKYACELCDFMAITLHELYTHLKDTHTKEKYKCHICDHESSAKESIDSHIQTIYDATHPQIHTSTIGNANTKRNTPAHTYDAHLI